MPLTLLPTPAHPPGFKNLSTPLIIINFRFVSLVIMPKLHINIDEMEKYFISVRFANKFIKISKKSKEADFNYILVRYVCEMLTLLVNHMYHAAGIKITECRNKA